MVENGQALKFHGGSRRDEHLGPERVRREFPQAHKVSDSFEIVYDDWTIRGTNTVQKVNRTLLGPQDLFSQVNTASLLGQVRLARALGPPDTYDLGTREILRRFFNFFCFKESIHNDD